MDLHDYRDVADNYDRYLAAMYAGGNDNHEGFLEFYEALARQYGSGGVVDIACGTGAVLLHLAERGIEVDGTDLSEQMCRVAAEKAQKLGLRLNIIPADMTTFSTGRTYSLAIIARSGFMHLPDTKTQKKALIHIRNQLKDGGILTLNTFDPWPPLQAQQMNTGPDDYSLRVEYMNCDGHRERIYNAVTYDPYTQQMSGSWKFVTLDEDGTVIRQRTRPLLMRQTYRSEMFLLAELCGFEVLDIYRGYRGDREDLSDPSSSARYSGNLIWVLKKIAQ